MGPLLVTFCSNISRKQNSSAISPFLWSIDGRRSPATFVRGLTPGVRGALHGLAQARPGEYLSGQAGGSTVQEEPALVLQELCLVIVQKS